MEPVWLRCADIAEPFVDVDVVAVLPVSPAVLCAKAVACSGPARRMQLSANGRMIEKRFEEIMMRCYPIFRVTANQHRKMQQKNLARARFILKFPGQGGI